MDKPKRAINWTNAIYFTTLPFVSVAAAYFWWTAGMFNWGTIILSLIFFSFIEISITAGYHRFFAHRSYQARLPVKLFFLIFGAAALQGSALQWSLDHRDHHNYVDDNEKDPYSINKGFFWAHLGWLLFKHDEQLQNLPKAGDLTADKAVMWQFKHWVLIGFLTGFILPALIAAFWGDLFGGLVIAGALRSVINHHSTFLINSLSHCMGRQTYSDSHSARDNWFTAFLTFGEGFHNYHHEFPSDYRNGVRVWDWDPTKWLIKGLSFVGLTSNLKKIREEIIVRKRLQMKEKRMHRKLEKVQIKLEDIREARVLGSLRARVEAAFKDLSRLRDEYQEQMKNKPDFVKVGFKFDTKELQNKINQARQEFFRQVRQWNYARRKVLAYAYVRA